MGCWWWCCWEKTPPESEVAIGECSDAAAAELPLAMWRFFVARARVDPFEWVLL
jgi:hypothetical protein